MSLQKMRLNVVKSQFIRPNSQKFHFPIYSHDLPLTSQRKSILASWRESPSSKKHTLYHASPLLSGRKDFSREKSLERRPFSSSGKNDLFSQLAKKVKKQKESEEKLKSRIDIQAEYYQGNKQNHNIENEVKPKPKLKKLQLTSNKSKDRYKCKQANRERQIVGTKIRFNRVGQKRKEDEYYDVVRTSQSEHRGMGSQQSLDMRPVM